MLLGSMAFMEENMSYFSIFFLATLFFFLLCEKINQASCSKHGSMRLPPGPWNLPIIGSIHHLLFTGTSLPHRALRNLSQRYGPLMMLKLGEVPTLVVSSPDVAKEIFKTHDVKFAARKPTIAAENVTYGCRGITFSPYGEHWRELRKICMLELLSPRRVDSFRSIREDEVKRFIQSVSASSQLVNLSKMLPQLANDIITRSSLGGICNDRDVYLNVLKEMMELLAGFSMADFFPSSWLVHHFSRTARKAKRCFKRQHEIFMRIVQERMQNLELVEARQEGLLDVLLRLQREGGLSSPLTMETIGGVLFDIFVAGSDTLVVILEWAMVHLMTNQNVMEKVQSEVRNVLRGCNAVTTDLDELHYLRMVLKETLRLHPPTSLLPRMCRETCQVMGYDIPEGTTVLVNLWAMGRDPRNWENAEDFKPERFENGNLDFKGTHFNFIPFGAGRRICPGMSFAMANIEITLASLLFHFDWELPFGILSSDLDMTEGFGITTRRKCDLLLRAKPLRQHISS